MFKTKTDTFLFVLICAVFGYVLRRAAVIDITHDEAYSFYNMKKFWYAEALCTGNTHWINSAAIKLAIIFNTESLFAIRWLSVVSFFIFCCLTWAWIRSTKEPHLKLFILSVLLFNPYILDYFSIARGYASGLMFQSLGLFFFFRFIKNGRPVAQFLALLFAGLSPLANFSFIYFFMAFCLVYFSYCYFKEGMRFLKNRSFYRDLIYSLGISALVIRAFMFMTQCSNDVIGAGTPFFSEYFHVFSDGLIYRKFHVSQGTLNAIATITFMVILFTYFFGIATKYRHRNKIYFFTACMLAIIITVTFINNLFFKIVWPYYRSAIFLFPTTAICFICFVNVIIANLKAKKVVMYGLSAVLSVNFIFSINFKSVFDFYIQANLKDSFDYVENLNAKHVGISPELYGGYRNYYQMTWKYHYNFFGEPINTNLPKGLERNSYRLKEFDYIILFPPYDMSYYKNNEVSFEALKIFPETGTLILRVRVKN